jgi:uncharacterized protein
MTVYSYPRPGAYINEQLLPLTTSGNNIPGEAVAVFAYPYNIGPVIPTYCGSWQAFTNNYGNFNVANQSPLHFAVYSYFANGGSGCYVLRVPNTNAVAATLALEDLGSQTVFTATAAQGQVQSPGQWGNSIYVEIVSLQGVTNAVNLNVYYGGSTSSYLVETFLNVSTNPASPRYVATIVNSPVSGSNYITLSGGLSYTAGTTDFAAQTPTALANGSDGSTAPTLDTAIPSYLDQYLQQTICNLNIPGQAWVSGSNAFATTINTIVSWAAGREDVFVLVDGPAPSFPETSATVASNYTGMVTGGSAIAASSFVAIHGPYLLVQDPSSSSPGATRYIPPSGSILGLWSGVDALAGVNQVAAGTSYGQLSCLGLEVNFSPTDLNTLFPYNINAIKLVPGYGNCVFGARTLLQGYPDMYIPIRRTLMKIEHDCVELTMFAMFEPNDPTLWSAITTVLTNYLTTQTLAGLLASTNPQTAYSVTCDSSNNTQQSAQAGQVNISIAVALGSPVEIIVINISQLTSGAITTTTTSGTGAS